MNEFPDSMRDRNVCVMGLGYVGLTLAVAMADVGFNVHGVEIRANVVRDLLHGQPHFHEPGLAGRLARVLKSKRLTISQHVAGGPRASLYIVTVGTPLNADGKVRVDMIVNVVREIADHLRDGDMVMMRSTVELGTTRKIVKPILDATGRHYDLVFCPERTLEGQALRELRELPQIVGGHDRESRIRAAQVFQFLTPTVVQVSSLETAELIKLVDNAQRDVHFGLSNEVARIADAIGVSAVEVIRAGKLGYPRTQLPMPGPVGGPCLEKDFLHSRQRNQGAGNIGRYRHGGAAHQRAPAWRSCCAAAGSLPSGCGLSRSAGDHPCRCGVQGAARNGRPSRHHGNADFSGSARGFPGCSFSRLR